MTGSGQLDGDLRRQLKASCDSVSAGDKVRSAGRRAAMPDHGLIWHLAPLVTFTSIFMKINTVMIYPLFMLGKSAWDSPSKAVPSPRTAVDYLLWLSAAACPCICLITIGSDFPDTGRRCRSQRGHTGVTEVTEVTESTASGRQRQQQRPG